MAYWVVDRFEGDFCVCEDPQGNFVDIPKSQVSPDVCEGDVLSCENGLYTPDAAETQRRRARALALLHGLAEPKAD